MNHKPIKYRNKVNPNEIYLSFSHWTPQNVDGAEFLAVVKSEPSNHQTQVVHYILKSSLEKVNDAGTITSILAMGPRRDLATLRKLNCNASRSTNSKFDRVRVASTDPRCSGA